MLSVCTLSLEAEPGLLLLPPVFPLSNPDPPSLQYPPSAVACSHLKKLSSKLKYLIIEKFKISENT